MRPLQLLRLIATRPRVVISASDFELFPRQFLYKFVAVLLGLGRAEIQVGDTTRRIKFADLVFAGWGACKDAVAAPLGYAMLRRRLRALAIAQPKPRWSREYAPLYMRVESTLNSTWGGMASHMLGVLGALAVMGPRPWVVSSTLPDAVEQIADTERLEPVQLGWNRPPAHVVWAGLVAERRVRQLAATRDVGFVYQRNSPFVIAGLIIARQLGKPFILEYNGSESWMAQHWGRGLLRGDLLRAVEDANLRHADLVVTVSAASATEVIARGARPDRVLALPNGVDATLFTPDCDASVERYQHGLENRRWVGFSGSFGPWHGVDVLLHAMTSLVTRQPNLREQWGLLLIGDGPMRASALAAAEAGGIADVVRCPGAVAPEHMPALLACCDILVSPQIANPDGSEFFGSPTKLFEYMAMQRAVIASELGQMADVISHNVNGLLVQPGDATDLSMAIEKLCGDPEARQRLGEAARESVLRQHTWRHHVQAILRRLEEFSA
jgi:glycosyltransferase involved in cell wall biosynthesis